MWALFRATKSANTSALLKCWYVAMERWRMTSTPQLEADCFRYYLNRILTLDGSVPEELKHEIAAVLSICNAGADTQKLLEERDRRIQMLDLICKFAFERIAALENGYLVEEWLVGSMDKRTRSA